MKYQLFEEVFLRQDVPEKGLQQGDVATIVDVHPGSNREDGYSLEVFNVFGETLAVLTMPESAIAPLSARNIFNVRFLADSLDEGKLATYAKG